jgi:hypothetical protein
VRYAFIERNRRYWPVSVLCELLGVSPSGYHQRKQRTVSTDRPDRGRLSDDALLAHIKAIHAGVKGSTAGRACGRNCWRVGCGWARSVFAS